MSSNEHNNQAMKGEDVSLDEQVPLVKDPDLLLSYGVCRVPIPADRIDAGRWAEELSRVTPINLTAEGDGEYAFYRNTLDEPDFPFGAVLDSAIGESIVRHFGIKDLEKEIRLDDAFCVHYNGDQEDTSGAKHVDPSDITVNMCLEKTSDLRGSHVVFYGTRSLLGLGSGSRVERAVHGANGNSDTCEYDGETDITAANIKDGESVLGEKDKGFRFIVEQVAGTATIHWGDHPHETLALEGNFGRRTNIVLTYCYTDPNRSDVSLRSCYAT